MIKKTKSSPWKRFAALAIVPAFGLFFWASAQPRYIVDEYIPGNTKQKESIYRIDAQSDVFQDKKESVKGEKPLFDDHLFIVDDIEVSAAEARALDPEKIESMNIIKKESAIQAYGEKGKNGVVVIIMKK